MYLYLIRHGQSANNLIYATTGSDEGREADPLLTETGCRQADLLAAYLKSEQGRTPLDGSGVDTPAALQLRLTHLYTSPMQRAIMTGLPSARALGLALTAWKDLHEGGGLYLYDPETEEHHGKPGPDRAWVSAHYPELGWPPEMGDGPWWNRAIEERPERLPRARRVLADLLARHGGTDDRVAFFTHAAFTNYFLGAMVGMPDWRAPLWFAMYNCAITCIKFRPEQEPALIFLNRTHHLPDEMITG